MSYGGESNGKKLARGALWLAWGERWCGGDPVNRDILVFSGPEAADVRAAKAVGADPHRIVVVDNNIDHINNAVSIHPEPRYVNDDVFDLLSTEKNKYDMIFFDFCQTLSDKLLSRVVKAAKMRLKRNGLLLIGAMYGREREEEIREMIEQSRQRFAGHEHQRPAIYRLRVVMQYLRNMCMTHKMLTAPAMLCSYRSGKLVDGRSVGVPMIYAGFFVRSFRRYQGHNHMASIEDQLNEEVERMIGTNKYILLKEFGDDAPGEKLREEVLSLSDKGHNSEHLAEVFNLKRQQVAAWKAWRTMRGG